MYIVPVEHSGTFNSWNGSMEITGVLVEVSFTCGGHCERFGCNVRGGVKGESPQLGCGQR